MWDWCKIKNDYLSLFAFICICILSVYNKFAMLLNAFIMLSKSLDYWDDKLY